MEIGSIYEINTKTVENSGSAPAGNLRLAEVQKYQKKYCSFTASGREAIALSLRSLEVHQPDIVRKCLLPAYMCDTVFLPFEQAGWELYFYHIGRNLETDAEELCAQIEHIRPGLLFIHAYYGVDTWKPIRSLLKEWKGRGVYIMEDVTQSYYLEEAGKEADYVIGSLRKWYPIPDGGFTVSNIPLPDRELSSSEEFAERRLALLTEKWEYLYGDNSEGNKKALKADYLKKNKEMEDRLDRLSGMNAMSGITGGLLRGKDEEACKLARNGNYKILCAGLKQTDNLSLIVDCNLENVSPLYFPVYVKNRSQMQEYLRIHDIYAPVLWPVGRQNEACLSETEQYIYDHLLAIPMDQRYGRTEMERIIEVINCYDKRLV